LPDVEIILYNISRKLSASRRLIFYPNHGKEGGIFPQEDKHAGKVVENPGEWTNNSRAI